MSVFLVVLALASWAVDVRAESSSESTRRACTLIVGSEFR
jgi:hypothetical protein